MFGPRDVLSLEVNVLVPHGTLKSSATMTVSGCPVTRNVGRGGIDRAVDTGHATFLDIHTYTYVDI